MSERNNDTETTSRRRFIAATAAGAALSVTSGVHLVELAAADEEHEGADATARYGMLIDTDKCAKGCDACVQGCNEEHGITAGERPSTDAQWIRKVELQDNATGALTSLPVMCQHCEDPPCVDVCPTGASFKRADGIVLVNKHTCIGCRYCMLACPFSARSFIHEALSGQKEHAPRGKGTVESCTLCVHRIDDNNPNPACAQACADEGHEAILFGDLNEDGGKLRVALKQHSTVALRGDLSLRTAIRYRNVR